jgi:hypothetical protein
VRYAPCEIEGSERRLRYVVSDAAIVHSMGVYEVRGEGVRRFLFAPFAGMLAVITIVSVILFGAGGWLLLPAPIWLAWIGWRTSRLRLRADASGIMIVNLVRRYEIRWPEVRYVSAHEGDFHDFPATVTVGRRKGRLWSVRVHATLAFGKRRRREVAVQIGELSRAYGYGFPTGDAADFKALHRAGLLEDSDPAAHQAWWDAHEPGRSAVK